jgi:predicted  nucleic acid-binding Zn-ribbon protein
LNQIFIKTLKKKEMKTINKNKVIAGVSTGLLFVAIIGIAVLKDDNGTLNKLLRDSKLDSEKLLSEKLSAEKQIELGKKELQNLEIKSVELQKQIDDANAKISEGNKKLRNQYSSNANTKKLQAELANLKKSKATLETQLKDLNASITSLKSNYDQLVANNETLQIENSRLLGNIENMKALASNNYRVDATKGKKEKLTVIAKRADKIALSFDVPLSNSTSLSFRITAPDGTIITDADKGISVIIDDSESMLLASTSDMLSEIVVTKRIEMTYKPTEKLKKGIYHIEIFNGGTPAGKCQVKMK